MRYQRGFGAAKLQALASMSLLWRACGAITVSVLVFGCTRGGEVGSQAPEVTENASALDCGPAIPGIDAILSTSGVVLFGEIHGTAEIPEFIGSVICQAAERGLAVRAAFEMGSDQQDSLDTFLDSQGTAGDRQRLLASSHWQGPPFADGRSSEAMFGLLERLRRLRRAGANVQAVGIETARNHSTGLYGDRDYSMAVGLKEIVDSNPDALVIGLMGSYHAGCAAFQHGNGYVYPVGHHLRIMDVKVLCLRLHTTGGTAWTAPGGIWALPNPGRVSERNRRAVSIQGEPSGQWDGYYDIGVVTASAPARNTQGAATAARKSP